MALAYGAVRRSAGPAGARGLGFQWANPHWGAGADEPVRHGSPAGGVLQPRSGAGSSDSAKIGADAGAATTRCFAGFDVVAVVVSGAMVADVGGRAAMKRRPTGCKP